jgi:hypothetical protein
MTSSSVIVCAIWSATTAAASKPDGFDDSLRSGTVQPSGKRRPTNSGGDYDEPEAGDAKQHRHETLDGRDETQKRFFTVRPEEEPTLETALTCRTRAPL